MSTPLPLHVDADRIGTITIEPNQGPMVVLDRPLIERLRTTFNQVPKNLSGLILASGSPRVFIAGADLRSIAAMSVDELDAYLALGQEVFGMLCRMRLTTVAAINGAALGGGLELAMHCDGLVAAPPPEQDGRPGKAYPIGLPEASLSICPGWGGTNLLPARLNPAEAITRTCTGRTWLLPEAQAAGLFDAVAAQSGDLLATAAAWLRMNPNRHEGRADGLPLRWIGREQYRRAVADGHAEAARAFAHEPPTSPANCCLRAVHSGLEGGWRAALDLERRELNRLRNEPAGREAIAAFLNKSTKR
jgi:enoyl-CoA hydratase/carnithine racemase